MYYQLNRLKAQTKTTKPTLTDQSAAKDTDINIIVKQFLGTGQAPGNAQQPMHEDFTQYPEDLRGFIEAARKLPDHIGKLPPELKGLTLEQLTTSQTTALLTTLVKPAPTPAPPKDNQPK